MSQLAAKVTRLDSCTHLLASRPATALVSLCLGLFGACGDAAAPSSSLLGEDAAAWTVADVGESAAGEPSADTVDATKTEADAPGAGPDDVPSGLPDVVEDATAADAAVEPDAVEPDAAEPDAAEPDAAELDGTEPDIIDPPPSGTISVYLAGDLTAKSFDDGLAGQTPTDFVAAISRYQVLTSADDPSPVDCFHHLDEPTLADLHEDTLVGTCDTATIPTAYYTHGRTRVEWATFTVQATLHGAGLPIAGTYTFFRAYSDTTYGATSYLAGEGFVTFSGSPDVVIPWVYGPPPSVPGTTMEVIDGELWMTFPFTHPLPIDGANSDAHWARSHWAIADAFRWQDLPVLGYSDDVWDVSLVVAGSEPVMLFGISGYYVTSSVD